VHVIGVAENGYPRLVGPNADSNMYVVSSLGASVPYIRMRARTSRQLWRTSTRFGKTLVPKVPMRRSFSDELFNISYEDYAAMSGVVTGFPLAPLSSPSWIDRMAIHITSRRLHEIASARPLSNRRRCGAHALRDFSKRC